MKRKTAELIFEIVVFVTLMTIIAFLMFNVFKVVPETNNESPTPETNNESPTETVIVEKVRTVTEIVTEIKEVVAYPEDYKSLLALKDKVDEEFWKGQQEYYELVERYQNATYVWFMLKSVSSMSNEAIAGIMGNIMNECGGNTLLISPFATNKSSHYGICQWSRDYHPEIFGESLEQQILYLVGTLPEIFDTYGYLYKKGFTYDDFCSMTSVDDAADAFRIVYERPGKGTEAIRRYNARLAYCTFIKER